MSRLERYCNELMARIAFRLARLLCWLAYPFSWRARFVVRYCDYGLFLASRGEETPASSSSSSPNACGGRRP